MDCEYYGSTLPFEHAYHCKPFSKEKNNNLESGNKIIMPASARDLLAALTIDPPMVVFQIKNYFTGRASHCGVIEFTAEEGFISMPQWMMKNLDLQEDDLVMIMSVSLSKGTYVKLQPHKEAFIELPNPKVVLEEVLLKNFSCLSTGDTIELSNNLAKFLIDIVETRPSSTISIVEGDLEVDFASLLVYKQPVKVTYMIACKDAYSNINLDKKINERPKFRPFTGLARRLDGGISEIELSSIVVDFSNMTIVGSNHETSSKNIAGKKSGNIIFDSAPMVTSAKNKPVIKHDVKNVIFNKGRKRKFEPFTGKKYKLMI